jgi:hypothetical protein
LINLKKKLLKFNKMYLNNVTGEIAADGSIQSDVSVCEMINSYEIVTQSVASTKLSISTSNNKWINEKIAKNEQRWPNTGYERVDCSTLVTNPAKLLEPHNEESMLEKASVFKAHLQQNDTNEQIAQLVSLNFSLFQI